MDHFKEIEYLRESIIFDGRVLNVDEYFIVLDLNEIAIQNLTDKFDFFRIGGSV